MGGRGIGLWTPAAARAAPHWVVEECRPARGSQTVLETTFTIDNRAGSAEWSDSRRPLTPSHRFLLVGAVLMIATLAVAASFVIGMAF